MSNPATAENSGPDPRWYHLRERLLSAKRPIFQEIRDYPPQVAGCDLHFKALAEQRDAICRELDRLDALCTASRRELDAFEASSAFLLKGG
ncbi:MAG: hypothetical protein COW30_07210 [Rhodospirillales bacterium CG15_BIG_FIL_POST_REV_8_21_14_020_66_15]|nr:MAG: hypothetical protein COW30_07210 [Rhodospirillales bacterium CG15_BIG_FIL_POST_REV_8_21_14_020_66_15]